MTGYANQSILPEKAKELMSLETEYKEIISYGKIEEWYTAWEGRCYVSFSGGKDSTVLAYLVAKWLSSFREPPYPLTLVFVNTGLEYPEIQNFANKYTDWLRQKFPRVTVDIVRLRPKMNIRQVLTRYGYPVVSKEVSEIVADTRINPNCKKAERIRGERVDKKTGEKSIFNCENWAFLLDAPFKISARCCGVMKKSPVKSYEHLNKARPLLATMADESNLRLQAWMKTGCNAFDAKRQISKPMSFWTEQDVLKFLRENDIPYCGVYGEIVASDGVNDYDTTLCDAPLHCTGCQRTGCMFCALGAHLEKGENRYERLKRTHPRHYEFCIGGGEYDPTDGLWKPNEKGLGFARILDFVGVRY